MQKRWRSKGQKDTQILPSAMWYKHCPSALSIRRPAPKQNSNPSAASSHMLTFLWEPLARRPHMNTLYIYNIYIYIYICISSVCVCVCMCVYIYIYMIQTWRKAPAFIHSPIHGGIELSNQVSQAAGKWNQALATSAFGGPALSAPHAPTTMETDTRIPPKP